MENKERERLLASIQRLNRVIILMVFAMVFLVIYIEYKPKFNFFKHEKIETVPYVEQVLTPEDSAWQEAMVDMWYAPDIDKVMDAKIRKQLEYGKDLIAHTAKYFGPNGSIRKSTNGLNCQNCHLDAGTKPWGNNYAAVKYGYPRYRPRSGAIETIEKRINDCFERSLNGLALDPSSQEMKAMKAYIQFLGSNTKKGDKPKGAGIYDLPLLKRAASPQNGKSIYDQKCASCHGADGQGQLNPDKIEYLYPPLWGPNAYNEGAGLYRLSRLAGYVRFNMPFGVTIDAPQLSNEEAWDVAAFVNSQPHPTKDLSKDWPKMEEKPMDHPFGPFADGFSEKQHKLGPFQSIKAAKKKKK
jgi:thiosulfate dehydrogenase